MSMAIAGENKPGCGGAALDAMAYEGLAWRQGWSVGIPLRMSADLPEAISRIIGDERLLPVE